MEDWYNSTLQNDSYFHYDDEMVRENPIKILFWITVSIGLPLIILAIYSLYYLVRDDHVAPIYVINLLISDIIQLCCMALWSSELVNPLVTFSIYLIALLVSVGFMICVSLERYLFIAWPLWYRFRRNIKASLLVCVVVWLLPVMFIFSSPLISSTIYPKALSILLLLPFPVFIFSVVGIFRGLSAAISISSEEKRRIVGASILVLLNYSLLFLPMIIWFITFSFEQDDYTLIVVARHLILLSPLADLVLYVFMRKGAVDKLLASVCCCRMDTQQEKQNIAVIDDSV